MGGGARYPYPKHVWTPSGGWWTRPSNWKSNTAIVGLGIAAITYVTWKYSAAREHRLSDPIKPIPSQLWAKQYQDRQSQS
ncbi:uncharacterized protein EI90DRAFT_152771 [Cantharellus anzutake]|uniref:uncharacterized protein n=1 Tax=Cantharellus anzutake TaxID=1750568 RepID=UPI001907320C|nr:uncharacterized protein EI90DRAFT_152771 [Cantharellus anzutake]KAF8336258.1 hypothetical protein EI90DRAFT_152771 [Cantharellus anzutake]